MLYGFEGYCVLKYHLEKELVTEGSHVIHRDVTLASTLVVVQFFQLKYI